MNNLEQLNPAYQKHIYRWDKVDDCVALDVKEKDWQQVLKANGMSLPSMRDYYQCKVYLPYPTNTDTDEIKAQRYFRYVQRAIFAAYTKRTHDGFLGMVYRKAPKIEIDNPQLSEWAENVTGTGLNLDQLSKDAISKGAKAGRCAIYTTYPSVEEGATVEQTSGLNPVSEVYRAQDILDWSEDGDYFVLREMVEIEPEKFGEPSEFYYQYRVLRLRDGVATSQIYTDEGEQEEVVLINGFGVPFDYIPLRWIGTVNNDSKIDESLLEGIADLNIGHYRNSADLEENCFIHGQGTMFISSDMSVEDWQRANPSGIQVGSNAGHFIGSGGNASLLQAEPNQVADNLMKRKEEQMIQLGASMTGATNFQSATEAEINASTESANLVSLVDNVSEALEWVVYDAGQYMGIEVTDGQVNIKLNKDFFPTGISAQEMLAYIQLYDRGVIGNEELREPLRKEGHITREDSEIDEETANRGLI